VSDPVGVPFAGLIEPLTDSGCEEGAGGWAGEPVALMGVPLLCTEADPATGAGVGVLV